MKDSPLGQATVYVETYSPELLFPVPRTMARETTGIPAHFSFFGEDIWNGYEISWLDNKGKPQIAMAEFRFPCHSPFLVESKSFKLYLNSFNQSSFSSAETVESLIQNDLSRVAQAEVSVKLINLRSARAAPLKALSGICLDDLDVMIDAYEVDAGFLKVGQEVVSETLYTDLLKSNCLATGQPDWGSVSVAYTGPKINREGLLKYFISFRRHAGFAEHCVEQIYFDLMARCHPTQLLVYGRYTRRGGLDINPYRASHTTSVVNQRQPRQ